MLSFFLHCKFLASLSGSSIHKYVVLLLGIQFCSIDRPVYLCTNSMQFFITIALWYSLRSGMVIPPAVLLLLRIVFTILGFLLFQMIFEKCSFHVFEELFWDFWWGLYWICREPLPMSILKYAFASPSSNFKASGLTFGSCEGWVVVWKVGPSV